MRLKLVTAPAAEPVSLDEAKNHLRVDGADENLLIAGLIKAARLLVENYTLRALITQTWELTLDSQGEEVRIPRPPLQSADLKIETIDDAGTKTTVSVDTYIVDASENSPGRVRLKSGCSWPTHRGFASFIVTFVAGYGEAASNVPEQLRQAILQVIAHLYEKRSGEEIPEGVKAMLAPYRIIWL